MHSHFHLLSIAAAGLLLMSGCSDAKKTEAPPVVQDIPEPDIEIKTEAQKAGYSVGVDNAQNLSNQFLGMNLDLPALAKGFSDELNQRQRRYPESEIRANVAAMRKMMTEKVVVDLESTKAAYSVGVDHAANLREEFKNSDLDLQAMAQGLRDEIHGRPRKVTDEELKTVLENVRKKMIDQMMADSIKAKAEKNKGGAEASMNLAAGQKFLEENAKKEGVKTTASGLQYIVLKEGDGPVPTPEDKVVVHYQGSLLDGKIFDSSYIKKQPLSFGVTEVIPGWTEGLQLMKTGSKYKFFIPSELAYGETGMPGRIGPNSVLIFEVELLRLMK